MKSLNRASHQLSDQIAALPALKLALPLFLGPIVFYHPWIAVSLLIFWCSLTRGIFCFICFTASALFFSYHRFDLIPSFCEKARGSIRLERVEKTAKGFRLKGVIHRLDIETHRYSCQIPVTFFYHEKVDLGHYVIEGMFQYEPPKALRIKSPIQLSFYQKMNLFHRCHLWLRERIDRALELPGSHVLSQSLLKTLLFGFPAKKEISIQFSKLGLSHLLAISGFHFSLIALHFSRLLTFLKLGRQLTAYLIITLTSYFLVLTFSASILRAFFTLILSLAGHYFYRPVNSVNITFASAIMTYLIHPMVLFDIGFQLSYLATLGILLIYPSIRDGFSKISPQRKDRDFVSWTLFEKAGYIFLQIMLPLLALQFAAMALTFPLIFYYFHSLSILSFYYNLMTPIFISLAMTLGLIATPIYLLLDWSAPYRLTLSLLDLLIDWLTYYPRYFDYPITCSGWTPPAVIITIFIVFITAIMAQAKKPFFNSPTSD